MEEKIYIKFNALKGESPVQQKGLKYVLGNIAFKILSTVIPKANPDFDHLIDKVEYWKIEYHPQENFTCREIGFDRHQNPIIGMPYKNNYGYWTDNNLTLDSYQEFSPTTIKKDDFNSEWNKFVAVNPLKNISIHGRQAYGLMCLIKALDHFEIKHTIINELIDKLWYYVEGKSPLGSYGDWWEEINNYDPEFVKEQPKTNYVKSDDPESDLETKIFQLYKKLPTALLKIIENTIWIARCNFFVGVTDYAPESLAHTINVWEELKLIGIEPPDLEIYLKNDFKIKRGWGHPMLKAELIK